MFKAARVSFTTLKMYKIYRLVNKIVCCQRWFEIEHTLGEILNRRELSIDFTAQHQTIEHIECIEHIKTIKPNLLRGSSRVIIKVINLGIIVPHKIKH